jgi:hypothetical protein
MAGFVEVPGFVEVWNAQNERISSREPCRFAWRIEPNGSEFRILTSHDLALNSSIPGEGWALVITDNEGRLLAAQALVGRPVGGAVLHIGAPL